MNIMLSNSDLKKQALKVTFSRRMTKSYYSQTFFNNILGIYVNEKLNFYHILARNVQIKINARFRRLRLFYYIYGLENLIY